MISDHITVFAGLPIREWDDDETGAPGEVTDPGRVAWRLAPDDVPFADALEHFLGAVDARRVVALVIGAWDGAWESEESEPVVRALAEAADRLPALRAIFLGELTQEETEISWIRHGDVTPLLEAFPLLERLEIRGADGLLLRPVRHERLAALRLETGGLPAGVVRAVAACDLPALEHLELWLGTQNYGGDATVADLRGILDGERLPALRHLGLQDSEIQDEIAAAVASAPVVARLESLSLSMGILTDEGAEALLSGQPLTHLKRLDLHHHFLSEPMADRIRAALPGVEVDLSDKEEPHGEWRYVAVSE